jgi:peptidoglycan/LPS O-acetylase OafA/YrhL
MDLVSDWFFCAAVGLAIPMFLEVRSRWLKSISKLIARYSYGIYVSHVPILWFCFTRVHLGSAAVSALLAVLLTTAISVFVYHWIEDPAIQVGKRLTTRVLHGRAFAVTVGTLEPAP